ncbi:GNAT family N-acetyltransferase [Parafilimonas sp.]|uniref:GNAT family N-acetyltransferase n=1 Tax=Parafilimonas sp. TaxID=1969739 RepID=UPI0039E2E6BE
MNYITVALNTSHNKAGFLCGKQLLDDYLHKQAKQDVKRKLSACFVLADKDEITVKGYYTLSGASVARDLLPENIIKKLPPSYMDLPATLLGRLAVDNRYKKQGLGELLLIDALKRSYDISVNSIGSMAVITDPIDEAAVSFYKKYGFILLPGSGKMFIPMDTVAGLF